MKPEKRAEKPEKRAEKPAKRAEKPARPPPPERRPAHDRPAPPVRQTPGHERQPERRPSEQSLTVKGFGDQAPAFMLVPARPARAPTPEVLKAEAEA